MNVNIGNHMSEDVLWLSIGTNLNEYNHVRFVCRLKFQMIATFKICLFFPNKKFNKEKISGIAKENSFELKKWTWY